MSTSAIEKDCSGKMLRAVEFLKQELRGIRTGQAHPGLVEYIKINVPSYGSVMELRELASISVPDPGTLLVKPFDPGTLKDIEKGLQSSDFGVTPISDGKSVRLPLPPLSGERRQQLVNQVKKMAEAQKISVRNARRDANKAVDVAEKEKTISEDDAKSVKDHIQKITKKHEDEIDALVTTKSKEIQEV